MKNTTEPLHFYLYTYCILFLSGACIGSFSLCMAGRWKRKEKLFGTDRSRCLSCGRSLGLLDLIPVFSYLIRGGKCGYCKEKIPVSCLLVEIFGGILMTLAFAAGGLDIKSAMFAALAAVLVLISAVDIETKLIPDILLAALAIIRIAFVLVLKESILEWGLKSLLALIIPASLLAFVLLYEKVRGKEAMGGGDIKLFGALALWLDWRQLILTLIAACFIGIFINGGYMLVSKKDEAFPFGPHIALAAMCVLAFGEPLINWYMGLL